MRVLLDYKCDNGTVTERFADPDMMDFDCECGCNSKARKCLAGYSYFKINGSRMDINTDAWAKRREDNARRKNS